MTPAVVCTIDPSIKPDIDFDGICDAVRTITARSSVQSDEVLKHLTFVATLPNSKHPARYRTFLA